MTAGMYVYVQHNYLDVISSGKPGKKMSHCIPSPQQRAQVKLSFIKHI